MPETATEVDDALVGQVLDGRYRIEAKLGEGGMGGVYRALHLKLERPVAVKVLHETFRDAKDVVQRFEREARTLSTLQHPNIVTITDFGVAEGLPYLVMELIEGTDLDTLVETGGALPVERTLALMTQVLRSLSYAHASGIVHRDLKPGNVLLRVLPDGTDHVEVLDFGLAKFIDDGSAGRPASPKLTRAGTILGTPAYMAPEQIEGQAAVDARTDVYAAGVMFFELLAGRLPFLHEDPGSMLRAHLVDTPPKLRGLRPEVPAALEALIERALAKAPEARFADGGAMLAALEELELEEPGALDQVTGKIKALGEGWREVSDELRLPERLSFVEERVSRAQSKLPEPLRKVPPLALLGGTAALGLLLVVLLGVALWPSPPTPPHAPGIPVLPPLPEGVALEDVEHAEGLPEAQNPWERGDVPEHLVPLKAKLDAGRRLGRREVGTITMVGRDHPDDCRPKLLHARAWAARRWLSNARPIYLEAFEMDPSCRGDPAMLADFIEMAMTETLEEEASQDIVRIWGEEAEEAVEARLEHEEASLRPVERRRLERLLDVL